MAKRVRHESISSTAEPSSTTCSTALSTHTPKYASLSPSETHPDTNTLSTMRCSLPPHKPQPFATYVEYESHYTQHHTNRCTECNRNLPSAHFLDLHIAENHDPLTAARRDAGKKVYACFVDGCEKVCGDWKKRRSHLVDKHGFPRNYDFFVVNTGIDGRRSMLRAGVDAQGHRKSSRERSGSSVTEGSGSKTEATSVSEVGGGEEVEGESGGVAQQTSGEGRAGVLQAKASNVDDLAESMSSLKMVPRSITFGKRKGRAGFAKS